MNPIEACSNWLEQVVIAHNFCPFAKKEFDSGRVHFQLCESTKVKEALELLIKECERLDDDAEIETSLIVYSKMLQKFDDFLDFVDLANELMELQEYDGVYQLAHFHPNYCFEGEDENDAANYTNRSPWPMLHLIRESSLEKALASYPQPETIPENNIKLARNKGVDYFRQLLSSLK